MGRNSENVQKTRRNLPNGSMTAPQSTILVREPALERPSFAGKRAACNGADTQRRIGVGRIAAMWRRLMPYR